MAVSLVGCSESATAWTEVLEVATGRHDLRFSTLLPLSKLVCGTNLIDRARRVCLACIEKDVHAGSRSYGRLLWRIAEVACCPEHEMPLVEVNCTRGRAAGRARYRRISVFGVCGDCGSIGYQCSHRALASVRVSPSDLRFARQCRDLIAGASDIEGSDPTRVKMALRIHADATGGMVRLAERACLPKSLLSRWLSKPGARLSLRAYFNLSEVAGYSMLELMSGAINDKPAGDPVSVTRVRRPCKPVNKVLVANELATTLEGEGSIQMLHKALGIDRKSLRRVSPDVYDMIVLRSQLTRDQEYQAKRRDAIAQAKDVLVVLLSQGLTPSLRNATALTKRPWLPAEACSVALLLLRLELGDSSVRLPARASRWPRLPRRRQG